MDPDQDFESYPDMAPALEGFSATLFKKMGEGIFFSVYFFSSKPRET